MTTLATPRIARAIVEPLEIRVNERRIHEADISREVQHHPADNLNKARYLAARALVIRELLLERADQLAIEGQAREDETIEEARIRAVIEAECPVPMAEVADCRRYFDKNREQFRTPDQHEVSHILLLAPPDDADARAEAKQRISAIREQLDAPDADFANLAREHSQCPSAAKGGHLGLIERHQTVREFEKALSRLPVGELSPYPLETRFGFHLVLIHQRVEGAPLAFEAVRHEIAAYLRDQVHRRAIAQYIKVLAGDNEVQGFDLDAAESPLVQ